MTKYFLSFLLMSTISVASYSQATTRQKTDELKKDPQTTERAAKADDRLIDKKNITDTSFSRAVTAKRKQAGCKLKRKRKAAGN